MRYSRFVALLVALPLVGCNNAQQASAPAEPAAAQLTPPAETSAPNVPTKVDAPHLPNAYRLTEKVISGGQPDGEEAFVELAALGVKTVISVDGMKPNVEAARRHGLRYVHMPHGYDGVPETRAKELAKAVRDLPGPIYIHCHHGKHRSPAAAAVACVGAGLLQPSDALTVLKTAGTSENYRGLYQSAESARRLDDALLDELKVDYPDNVKLPAMAEAMVAVEHTFDHLKLVSTAGWKPTAEHPDIDPPHEALLLKEHFTELLRTAEAKAAGERFVAYLQEGEAASAELETALNAAPADLEKATAAFTAITKNCAACHKEIRDVPLSEKQARRK